MNSKVVFLSIPALREQDLAQMPNLRKLVEGGSSARIQHSFPCVTWPSQANVLTGKPPSDHGVIANGFFWRDKNEVEMWTAWNEVIQQPQLWDILKQRGFSTAAWFPMLSKGCGADYVCMPAPIHKPDGSEDLWCYTKPQSFYGELLEKLEHFPLQHFWGPMANILSSKWIAESAVLASQNFQPDFFYIYIPHLDYQAQKLGPDSEAAQKAVAELDELIGQFVPAMHQSYGGDVTWMIASEYVITEVNHVLYPNRVLREAGLLNVISDEDGKELIDYATTPAWALVDHQFAHVFVRDESNIENVVNVFEGLEGLQSVSANDERKKLRMDHARSGEVILVSDPNSWQAYYWWQDDSLAPNFARTVDIHRKPGYDPVELHFDMATKSIPLDATLIKGSHGAPANSSEQHGIFLANRGNLTNSELISDFEIFDIVLDLFGD